MERLHIDLAEIGPIEGNGAFIAKLCHQRTQSGDKKRRLAEQFDVRDGVAAREQ
ncbi:MAG TPA: hypothetical protein VIB79_29330 [Candidatus Binatia bacterium]